MSKAVAIPYVVALILAIIVIVLIGYFLFFKSGIFTSTASEQECRGYEFYYCGLWAKNGYALVKLPDGKTFTNYYPQCASHSWASLVSTNDNECRILLSQQTTTTTP